MKVDEIPRQQTAWAVTLTYGPMAPWPHGPMAPDRRAFMIRGGDDKITSIQHLDGNGPIPLSKHLQWSHISTKIPY